MKTRSAAVLVALMVLLGALALAPVTAASAATPGGARTWHVLVGGQSADRAVQADGYYPHVITIDAGDTVTWALNTVQLVGVSFAGTCADISSSCAPQDCLTIFREDFQDFSPCGPSRYDGVTGLAQSGMMVSPVYSNWDTSIPHGATTYSLTFTRPGA